MRKFILILTFAFIAAYGISQPLQADKVPTNIKERVQYKFPQTLDLPVSWSMEKKNYKATMTIMDAPAIMVVDTTGRTLRIERRIHESYLPKKALAQLKSLDKSYEIISVTQITEGDELFMPKDKVKTTYKTVAKITTNFTFDSNGADITPAKK